MSPTAQGNGWNQYPSRCPGTVESPGRAGEKPKLSQLRESGAIEQDADVVALLHRERERQQEQRDGDNAGLPSEVIIAKNRNGATGTSELLFFPRYTRFENKGNAGAEDMPGATGEF